jgi:allophanate hydrolase subunit 2
MQQQQQQQQQRVRQQAPSSSQPVYARALDAEPRWQHCSPPPKANRFRTTSRFYFFASEFALRSDSERAEMRRLMLEAVQQRQAAAAKAAPAAAGAAAGAAAAAAPAAAAAAAGAAGAAAANQLGRPPSVNMIEFN